MVKPPETKPTTLPGDEMSLSIDDLLLLNGRVNAELALERSQHQTLRIAYGRLQLNFDALVKSTQEPKASKK